jgi:XTP/dITP diphosphohydrolase
MGGRLTVLAVHPAVEPGHLPWSTWKLVRAARVVAPGHTPWTSALREAGVPVEPVDVVDTEGSTASVLHACATSSSVVWVDDGTPESSRVTTALGALEGMPAPDLVEVGGGVPGHEVLSLVGVMDRLRSPGGCPWDAEQTHESLLPYLLEESYEVVDAVRSGDADHLREELGDLLLQVVFHARVAQEGASPFDVDDVARGIVDKLIRRHPHVFSGAIADDAADVADRWEDLKRAEKGRTSVLDGIPVSQPALSLAQTYLRKASSVDGVDVPPPAEVSTVGDERGLGELLLALVAHAQARGWDAEAALRSAAAAYAEQVRTQETRNSSADSSR